MPKFVLIDPSIAEQGGHYYEYAVRVLRAAADRGLEPMLATNRKLHGIATQPWPVFSLYRYGYFEPRLPRRLPISDRKTSTAKTCASARPAREKVAGVARDIARPLWRQAQAWLKRRAFGADSVRLFERLSLSQGDVVFLPTVADADMLGLLKVFRANRDTARSSWHLLFRRDLGDDAPANFSRPAAVCQRRQAFARFQSQSSEQQTFFYTDTEPLTAQYNSLAIASFRTLPIPVAAEYRADAAARQLNHEPLRFGDTGAGQTLHAVYLGDARTEKGYHWLPIMVTDARSAGLPVRFTFQSNYNVDGGEPAAAEARRRLESLAADYRVTLLKEPLSSDAYRRLLLSADVVVLPYDALAYRARSSGVFAEALAAGKPVIVPDGTWMADEVKRATEPVGRIYIDVSDLSRELAEIVGDYGRYRRAAAEFAQGWSAYHSPENLLEELLAGCSGGWPS